MHNEFVDKDRSNHFTLEVSRAWCFESPPGPSPSPTGKSKARPKKARQKKSPPGPSPSPTTKSKARPSKWGP